MGAAVVSCPDLLDRCVAGDRRAWGELDRLYRPHALAFLSRLGVGPREREDACQEVFVQIFRYLHRFERRADFRTWLYKLCISQAERLRRRAVLLRPLCWLGMTEPVSLPQWSESRAAELVDRALAALSARQRTVFVLFELEGLATAEVALVLRCPHATVRRQLQEARDHFCRFVRDEPLRSR
jgi:RNA polymerase sigma-70 factor (ECF subfamily)